LSRDLLVAAWDGGVAAALVDGGELLDWVAAPGQGAQAPGAIHLARVAQRRDDLGLVFVTLGGDVPAALEAGAASPRPGDAVLVQIVAAARDGKPARATARPSLVGRYVTLQRDGAGLRLPRTIPATDGARLEALAPRVPSGLGATLRSAAADAHTESVGAELAALAATWARIEADAARARAPALVHAEPAAWRAALPLLRARPRRILVAEKPVAHALAAFAVAAELEAGAPLFDLNDVAVQLAQAEASRVALPGGGALVVEATRALTAIDVDAGGGAGDAAALNRAAAREIGRQLRLRDLRGTVVVDFLRTGEASRRAVVDTLAASTAIDRRRVGLLGWTRGGLFELRRGEDLARE
jgi:ribonuclease G